MSFQRRNARQVQYAARQVAATNGYVRQNSCGCSKPQPQTNTAVMPVAPVCPTTIVQQTTKYKLKDCLGEIDLGNAGSSTTKELAQQVVSAYLFYFTMKLKDETADKKDDLVQLKRAEYAKDDAAGIDIQDPKIITPLTADDVWEAVPQVSITDGGRSAIPDDFTKEDWKNMLTMMGWTMNIEQPKIPSAGQIVKVMIPMPFSTQYASGSFEAYIGKSAFTPRSKPVLHINDGGDTAKLEARSFHVINVMPMVRPQFEKVITKKDVLSLSSAGMNCIETPVEGCADTIILYPAKTYEDGVSEDGAITIKTFEIEDAYKSLYTEDGPNIVDFYAICSQSTVPDSHWVPYRAYSDKCCEDGCIGLNCKTRIKVKCGDKTGPNNGSTLGIRYILLVPAYDGTPCCC